MNAVDRIQLRRDMMNVSDMIRPWYKNGKLHREDGPAVIYKDGKTFWYKKGKLHRDDGPAIICPYGTKKWYKNGKLHREDGPAVFFHDGTEFWYLDGKLIFSFREFQEITEHSDGYVTYLKLKYGRIL